jgi:N,N'-diacetyllegionaminate synthase
MQTITIGQKQIGPESSAFIIAEAGVNHNADPALALRLVDEAAAGGADAIKFQTYTASSLVTKTAPKYYVDTMDQWLKKEAPSGFQVDEFSQLDGLSKQAYVTIQNRCRERKIIFLSTPFDEFTADFLDELEVPAFKIASGDITSHQFLRHVAKKKKPILLSTGCSTLEEIEEALDVIKGAGNYTIALLHCTLSYPTALEDANLNMMKTMQTAFPDHPVGLSDHTLGTLAPVIAVSHGARLIEKHFTIDKTLGKSTDHFMSVDSKELKAMVTQVRDAEKVMGLSEKKSVPCEDLARQYARRSLVARRRVPSGAVICSEDLILKRPGTGLAPKLYDEVVGFKAARAIEADTVLTWDMLKKP